MGQIWLPGLCTSLLGSVGVQLASSICTDGLSELETCTVYRRVPPDCFGHFLYSPTIRILGVTGEGILPCQLGTSNAAGQSGDA